MAEQKNSLGDSRLDSIQSLQFHDRPNAEKQLLEFLKEVFPELGPSGVELRPSAVSLNSINGFLNLEDGRKLFFKTHVEPDSLINEYYNSKLLAEAGYPIYQPLYSSIEYGKQFLIYELVEAPSLFEAVDKLELQKGGDVSDEANSLAEAQHCLDEKLQDIYNATLSWQSAAEAANAPVHQLLSHRLGKRYQDFYTGHPFSLPGLSLNWGDLLKRRWQINGIEYQQTLGEAIEEARTVLNGATEGWSIIGHGDPHNGNLFLTKEGLVYFDPAFAGRHHPLFDLTKPLFHNVFATWMYYPERVAESLEISCSDDGVTIRVEHNYQPSVIREMFWKSKIERVLAPLIRQLNEPDWQRKLKLALMCCPLLTMNLSDRSRFSPAIGLLGLCYVIQTGVSSTTQRQSMIDATLGSI